MPPTPEPLQGSLFGELEGATLSNNIQKTHQSTHAELSDDELAKDATIRPRKRKKIDSTQEEASRSEKPLNSNALSDTPPWSNHKLVDKEQLPPMLRHYVELKSANPERILLYRLGDFFECFFEDAIKLSQVLELTLTGKEGGKEIGRVPMAGIPHHAAERYCSELIKNGYSVAICDQLEATPAKGNLIKREITRVLTPGTVIEEGMLQARKNNWLAAVVIEKHQENAEPFWGLASADVSTGEFLVLESQGYEKLLLELSKLEVAELILGESENSSTKQWSPENIQITYLPKTPFSHPEAELALKNHFHLTTLNGLGLQETPKALRAAGGLLQYLNNTNPLQDSYYELIKIARIPLDLPKIIFSQDSLIIDAQTKRNLEITTTQKGGQFQGSLLWAIDRTLTSMGGRCLRRWLEKPLMNAEAICSRQKIVTQLVRSRNLRHSIRRLLRSMGDLERLAGRAGAGQAGARDLVAIADGLERLPKLANQLKALSVEGSPLLAPIVKTDQKLIEIASKIREQLKTNPPLSLTEGGLIYDGVDPLLDGLRNQLDDQQEWLSSQELLERKLSGNVNLKLQFHRTFGYFLAVSKAKSGNVPEHWIRRQTLANEERFITPELKSREGKIFHSKARAANREYELFCKLREEVGNESSLIRKSARAVAGLDSLASLAEIAATNNYCPPHIQESNSQAESRKIKIIGCRHPVVEQLLAEELFVPNNITLGTETDLIILTGPNASGKSCYLRQIGLIQLLTQIGSWVPAKEACLSIADRIFTRVGAVDDLAAGQSTFMVEMAETASILHQATEKSLVLLDEIGRGTATFDGLAIAWSVSEFLAKKLRSRTIFATHYHELNNLAEKLDNVANFQVLVEETGKDLRFLHKVAPGGASRSYGIEAARLAGIPQDVIERANTILDQLQKLNLINHKDLKNIDKSLNIHSAAQS